MDWICHAAPAARRTPTARRSEAATSSRPGARPGAREHLAGRHEPLRDRERSGDRAPSRRAASAGLASALMRGRAPAGRAQPEATAKPLPLPAVRPATWRGRVAVRLVARHGHRRGRPRRVGVGDRPSAGDARWRAATPNGVAEPTGRHRSRRDLAASSHVPRLAAATCIGSASPPHSGPAGATRRGRAIAGASLSGGSVERPVSTARRSCSRPVARRRASRHRRRRRRRSGLAGRPMRRAPPAGTLEDVGRSRAGLARRGRRAPWLCPAARDVASTIGATAPVSPR